jgi:hypothetical protein
VQHEEVDPLHTQPLERRADLVLQHIRRQRIVQTLCVCVCVGAREEREREIKVSAKTTATGGRMGVGGVPGDTWSTSLSP